MKKTTLVSAISDMQPTSQTLPQSIKRMKLERTKTLSHIMGIGVLSLLLSACGSDSNSTSSNTGTTPTPANFSETAEWRVDTTNFDAKCYDFDVKAETECSNDNWDVELVLNADRSYSLLTNSGISGSGNGAAFNVMPWTELANLKNAQEVPTVGFKPDSGMGVFEINPWFEYNLNGAHKLFPNNRVYLVSTDASNASTQSTASNPVYAMQVINYYDDAGVSGNPSLRWIDTALPTQVQTQMFDATDADDWVYVNLATGQTTTEDGDWQVGLRRNDVILNGGASGDDNVGGYVAKTPTGYYDEAGEPIASVFKQDNRAVSLADLTAVADYDIPADGVPWILDEAGSELNPERTGSYPVIDYGWYVYDANQGHRLFAKPEGERIGGLVRSGEGDSYARFYLEDIVYADGAMAPSEWVFKFDVQPAE